MHHHYTVRPSKVISAVIWLVNHSQMYKEEGITLNQNWLNNYDEALNVDNEINHDENEVINDNKEENNEESSQNDEDEWSEDQAEICTGVTDTLLMPPDFVDHNEQQCILNVAPAEGNRPLSISRDEYSEELAYPGIFLGQKTLGYRNRLVKVLYSDICNQN